LLTEPANNYSILKVLHKKCVKLGKCFKGIKYHFIVFFAAVVGNKTSISGLLVTCFSAVLPGHKEKPSLLTEPADNYSILKVLHKKWVKLGKVFLGGEKKIENLYIFNVGEGWKR
jgi:hypothetical protein